MRMILEPPKDRFDALFRKIESTETKNDQLPYLILLQHSKSCQKRYASKIQLSAEETKVYRGANLRTPSENATRDSSGDLWLDFFMQKLTKDRQIIYIQTTRRNAIDSSQHVHTIDLSKNPFGWDPDKGASIDSFFQSISESNPNNIITSLISKITKDGKQNRVPLVLDSLSLLHGVYGIQRCIDFLEGLKYIPGLAPVIVPANQALLSKIEHRQLEDIAQAVLWLESGEAVFLRHGVRETGNLIRENVPFEVSNNRIVLLRQETLAQQHDEEKEDGDTKTAPKKSGKVTLKLESDDQAPKKNVQSSTPQIVMEDEDEEFADYDSEDPDDDLEI